MRGAAGLCDVLEFCHGLIQLVRIFRHHLPSSIYMKTADSYSLAQVADLPADNSELDGEFFADVDNVDALTGRNIWCRTGDSVRLYLQTKDSS